MFSSRSDATAVLARRDLLIDALPEAAVPDRVAVSMPVPSAPLLTVEGLGIATASGAALVRDVGFSIRTGGTLGVVGESGSGKSLTCRAILGLLPTGLHMTGGAVRLNGRDLHTLAPNDYRDVRRERFGAVFQDPGSYLNPSMRIGEQIAESVRVHKRCSRPEARERTFDLLQAVGMRAPAAVSRQFPYELSGGMLQRVLIAIALSGDPDVLIADEVTTALDVVVQKQVITLLQSHQATRGLAMIVVSHDLALVSEVCDDLVVMQKGVVVEQGTRAEVLGHPRHPYTRSLIGNHLKYGLENYD